MDDNERQPKEEQAEKLKNMLANLSASTCYLALSYIIAFAIPEYLCRHDYDAKLLRGFELVAAPFVLFVTVRVARKWMAYRAQKRAFNERYPDKK